MCFQKDIVPVPFVHLSVQNSFYQITFITNEDIKKYVCILKNKCIHIIKTSRHCLLINLKMKYKPKQIDKRRKTYLTCMPEQEPILEEV